MFAMISQHDMPYMSELINNGDETIMHGDEYNADK